MVYGVIEEKAEKFYTYLPKIFDAIGNVQGNYNWLITDCSCNITIPIEMEVEKNGYCWISGEELTEVVTKEHIQWIFAVLSGFPKDIPLEDVLKYPLPLSQIPSFWQNPISIQHPLAEIELVPWDSCRTLLFSRDKLLVDRFRAAYPESQDLNDYNEKRLLFIET